MGIFASLSLSSHPRRIMQDDATLCPQPRVECISSLSHALGGGDTTSIPMRWWPRMGFRPKDVRSPHPLTRVGFWIWTIAIEFVILVLLLCVYFCLLLLLVYIFLTPSLFCIISASAVLLFSLRPH